MRRFIAGPWYYSEPGAMVRTADDQQHVCDIRGFGKLDKEVGTSEALKIMDATGELIAAAPDMLAALQECVTDFNAHCMQDGIDGLVRRLEYINSIAEAAIKKATNLRSECLVYRT